MNQYSYREVMNQIEYRGFTRYEVESLATSGQAEALGYSAGRRGAYEWIDNWYDKLNNKRDGKFYPKPNY
jgi:hypothetical protein